MTTLAWFVLSETHFQSAPYISRVKVLNDAKRNPEYLERLQVSFQHMDPDNT